MDIKSIVLELCAYNDEQEWFEFKENWFQPEILGEYVSAMSNAAAFHYRKLIRTFPMSETIQKPIDLT